MNKAIEKYQQLIALYDEELLRICRIYETEPAHDFQREVQQLNEKINNLLT
jgi:hypothetical protein